MTVVKNPRKSLPKRFVNFFGKLDKLFGDKSYNEINKVLLGSLLFKHVRKTYKNKKNIVVFCNFGKFVFTSSINEWYFINYNLNKNIIMKLNNKEIHLFTTALKFLIPHTVSDREFDVFQYPLTDCLTVNK